MKYKNIPYNNVNYYWVNKMITLKQYKYLLKKYNIDTSI